MALALVLSSASAMAQNRAEERQRSELIQRATQARAQGQWPEVVRLLRQVVDIRATASVRLGLAGAYQELGQHDEAASQAALCMQTAPADRDLRDEQRTALVDTCGQVLREATALLATVTVETVPDSVQGVTLRVDGEAVEGFAPGRPFYLTPGRRRFRLEAAGRAAVEHSDTLQAGATRTVRLQMGAAEGRGFLAGTGGEAPPGAGQSGESLSVAPWVIGGLGLAAGVSGVVLLALSENNLQTIERNCQNLRCSTDEVGFYQELESTRTAQFNWGLGLLISGGASVAISGVWLLVRTPNTSRASTTGWHPSPGGFSVSF